MMSQDIDYASRIKIKEDIHHNFFVEAGAGSGKTTVLVDRMVSMVEGGLDISKICAITFTKAAASEFYARFQKKLSESDTPNAKEALKNIDLCFLGTIDSFCNMVLSEHPSAAKIPSNASVMEDEDAQALYIREYEKILDGLYGDLLQDKAKRFHETFYNARDIYAKGISICMKSKNAKFMYRDIPNAGLDIVLKEEKERLVAFLEILKNNQEIAYQGNKDSLASWEVLLDSRDIFGDWDHNAQNVLRDLKAMKKLRVIPDFEDRVNLGVDYDYFLEAHYTKEKIKWYELKENDDVLLIDRIQDYFYNMTLDFITSCVEPISNTLRNEGYLTFSDCLLYLRDLFKEDAKKDGHLIQHVYNRHSYFLIDEFQDTNPIQAEIFFYLTAEKPVEDWRACKPKDGSLFIVGDPKQSIYRFNNADVSSFLRIKEMFENGVGEVLYLSRNFRSSEPMCIWFNEVFQALLPQDTETQSEYKRIPTGEKAEYKGTLSGAYKYEIANVRSQKDSQDFKKVCDIIQAIVQSDNITIQDRDGTLRNANYSDFMVITYRKTNLVYYMNAMNEAGIPYRIEGKVLFHECPALYSLSNWLLAIAYPNDKKREFAKTYLSGLENQDSDIQYYVQLCKMKGLSSVALFNILLNDKHIFESVGTHNAEYVYYALELLKEKENQGEILSIQDGADFIASLVNEESDKERSIQLSKNANCVHLANLHKVKGLEAPIVILANPTLKERGPEVRIDTGVTPPVGYIFNIDKAISTSQFPSEVEKETQVLNDEFVRLLYVAATRAGNVLIVSSAMGKSGPTKSPWTAFINHIHQDIDDVLEYGKIQNTNEKELIQLKDLEEELDSPLLNQEVLKQSYQLRRPSEISAHIENEDNLDQEFISREDGAIIGTLVHRALEILVSCKNQVDTSQLIQSVLVENHIHDNKYQTILENVIDTIQHGGYAQENGVSADILHTLLDADEVYFEFPFAFKEGVGITQGFIDVVYRKGDQWTIIDYKTNLEGKNLDEKYKSQLDIYKKALKLTLGFDADAKIYHINA